MRLEATSSNSTPTVTTLLTPEDEKAWAHARRQTEPSIRAPVEIPRPERRSVDSVSRLPTPKSSNLPAFKGNLPPITSDSLSNPALAAFSARKINALKSPIRAGATSSSSPLRQTLPATRNQGRSFQSATSAATSTSTASSPLSSILSPSSKLQSNLEPRSLHQKRAPASRSSYGIETSTGPPPALSTQRTLSHDKAWRPKLGLDISNRPTSFGRSVGLESEASPSSASNADAPLNPEPASVPATESRQRLSLSTGTVFVKRDDGKMATTATKSNGDPLGTDDPDRTLQTLEGFTPDTSGKASSGEDSKSKNEDVFLNIAKATSSLRNASSKPERRISKFGLSRSNRVNEQAPSPEPVRCDQSQDNSPSLGHAASAHPVDESGRPRYFGVSTRSSLGLPRSRLSRTNREMSPEPPQNYGSERGTSRVYRQSNLPAARSGRATSSLDGAGRARLESERSRLDGTESTLSTTAPSTVWDELDDLKSRIRKLELTGKLPSSSAAAMSNVSGERPRTATTTVTTLSSSPKHGRKASSPPPEPESESAVNAINQVHPLLHTVLAKAKPVLSSGVYRALEASTTDALTLATMLSSSTAQLGSGMSIANGANISERQMRRKADSICRSLTELCLALSDDHLSSQKAGPGSRDTSSKAAGIESTTPASGYRRSVSQEPEDMGRVHASNTRGPTNSRLEVRRTSMLNLNPGTSGGRSSQETTSTPTAFALSTPPNRLSRISTTLRTRRLQGEEDDDDATSALSRPLSRAVTEVNNSASAQRFSPRERLSYEYTLHPLPCQQQPQPPQPQQYQQTSQARASSLVQSALPLRRNYVSPTTNLPTTSNSNIQPGFRRYGASSARAVVATEHGTSELAPEGADSPQQHVQPQLRNAAPVGRSAPHYSSTQRLRPRTNSVGASKISIRQRPVTAIANSGLVAGNES